MTFDDKTQGTCSQLIHLEIEGDTLQNVEFVGGCHGNLQGIGALVRGMKVDDIIAKLAGIRCGYKNTSCPDQLARALTQYKAQQIR